MGGHSVTRTELILSKGIIGQIGHCIDGNFNIHIWAWSASPRATIAHLRVNKYSHWTKCFYVCFFCFFFIIIFFFFFFIEDLIKIEDAGVVTTVKN